LKRDWDKVRREEVGGFVGACGASRLKIWLKLLEERRHEISCKIFIR
jgi:hypothetical protein